MLRILLAAALLPAFAAQATEAVPAKPIVRQAKPSTATVGSDSATTYYWYDGGRRRGLVVDESLRADFVAGKAVGVNKAIDATTDTEAPDNATVFRDADSPAIKRALPGGVIITTRGPTDAGALDRLLAPRGLAVLRQLDASGTRWLVETPSGIAGLELANRLHESGDFAAAAPNWWRERALK